MKKYLPAKSYISAFLLTIALATACLFSGCRPNNDPERFVGTWVNNKADNGMRKGMTVQISRGEGELFIVHIDPKGGFEAVENHGTLVDGKINALFPPLGGKIQIAYDDEDGDPHIVFMGVKLDKQ